MRPQESLQPPQVGLVGIQEWSPNIHSMQLGKKIEPLEEMGETVVVRNRLEETLLADDGQFLQEILVPVDEWGHPGGKKYAIISRCVTRPYV